MMGSETDFKNGSMSTEAGIIPRFCHDLFERISSLDDSRVCATAEISYFEIYNEKIHDLLGGATSSSAGGFGSTELSSRRPPLKVREHPQYGPYVVDLSVHGVESYSDIQVKTARVLFRLFIFTEFYHFISSCINNFV